MGAKANLVDLAGALVIEMGLDHVLREHVALQEELMVRLERTERLLERAWG